MTTEAPLPPPPEAAPLPPPPPELEPRCIHGNRGSCPGCMHLRTAEFFDRQREPAPETTSIFASALAAARARAAAARLEEPANVPGAWFFGADAPDGDDDASKIAGIRALGAAPETRDAAQSIGKVVADSHAPRPLPEALAAPFERLETEIAGACATASTPELEHAAAWLASAQRRLAVELARRQLVVENKCSVCFDAAKNCVLMECMHVATCANCAVQLKTCPTCRAPVSSVRRIYTT